MKRADQSSTKLRFAGPSDVESLVQLVNSAYRGDSSRVGWTTEADLLGGQRTDPKSLRDEIENPYKKILCLISEQENEIIGCVLLEKKTDSQGQFCYLGMLTVKPDLQNGGYGRLVLDGAENTAKSWGAQKIRMTVISLREELLAWYIRRGYRKTDETERFPYGDERFGLPKRPDLLLYILEKSLS